MYWSKMAEMELYKFYKNMYRIHERYSWRNRHVITTEIKDFQRKTMRLYLYSLSHHDIIELIQDIGVEDGLIHLMKQNRYEIAIILIEFLFDHSKDTFSLTVDACWTIWKFHLKDSKLRKKLRGVLKCSKLFRKLLLNPEIFFKLLQKRECKFSKLFWKIEKPSWSNYKDEEGNDILTYLCGVRGKTCNIVTWLVENGVDRNHVNGKGENAIERATRIRNTEVIDVLKKI